MVTRRLIVTALGIVLLGLAMAPTGHAWSTRSSFSFSGPVALPGVTLHAGTYNFERAGDAINLVRVSSADERTVYLMTFANIVSRPSNLPMTPQIMFGESPRGVAPPIKAWYPDGAREGYEFIYSAR
jgi:hypothetical protein